MRPADSTSDAVTRLAEACADRAWRLAYALLRSPDEAYDAVQQAFLVAAAKAHLVPADDPWPWFSVVVTHEVRNLRRKRRPLTNRISGGGAEGSAMEPADPRAPEPTARAERDDDVAHMWREVDALPPAEREALLLVHLAGLTHAGAAEALGVPRQTVTERARRGLETVASRVRRDVAGFARYLAVIPMAAPRGGMASATAAWTEAATAAVATTSTGAAGAAAMGATMMGTKLWVAGLAVVAGIGFLGGAATDGFGLFDGAARPAAAARGHEVRRGDDATPASSTDGAPTAAPEASPPVLAGAGRAAPDTVEALRAENARLASRLAEAERQVETLRSASGGATEGAAPVFTFGEIGSLPAVREADWKDLSEASKIVTDSVAEMYWMNERGEEVPKELHMRLQENVERVRKYEYRTIDRVPTAAKHNGELTHPISVSNLVAGVLEARGVPLTAAQVAEVERIGTAFDKEFVSLRAGWGDEPRVRRMLEEYELKGRFTEGLWSVLTPEQRVHWVDPELRGVAGIDLYDPTLMILHTTIVFTGADADEIRPKLLKMLRTKLSLPAEEPTPRLDAHVDAFLARTLRGAQPVAKNRARHYTYAEGLAAGRATVALVEALLRDSEMPETARAAFADDFIWYLPRLVTS